jgi:hypothetical protein
MREGKEKNQAKDEECRQMKNMNSKKGGDPINCGNIAKRIPSKFMPLVTSLYNFENKLN